MVKKLNLSMAVILILAAFLRFYKLDSSPPSLYSDEISQGYNAYSILKTGRDEFGNFLPVTIRSFGDYKPPLSTYIMIPSIAVFGLNELGVRFPFALFGTLTVLLVYLLTKNFFSNKKLALLSALLIAISPWHIQQSRSAMLVGLEVFLVSLGVLLFFYGLKKKPLFLLSVVPFSLTFYTYYGSRITVPLLLLLLFLSNYKKIIAQKKLVFITCLFGLLLLLPLIYSTIKNPQTITGRAKTISVFYQPGVKIKLWEDVRMDGGQNPLLTRFFHNKVLYYSMDIVKRYFQHFDPNFLFFKGSQIPPFEIPDMGIFYLPDSLFLVLGVLYILSKGQKEHLVLFGWLLISPVVASITFMTPASNRSFNMVIPAHIIIALGIVYFVKKINAIKKRWLVTLLIIVLYFVSFLYFQFSFHLQIPQKSPKQWSYGKKQIVEELEEIGKNYKKIVFIRGGPYYIYLLFYKGINPTFFVQSYKRSPKIDELGWENIENFQNYEFIQDDSWKNIKKEKDVLYISLPEDISSVPSPGQKQGHQIIKEISYPNGQAAYWLVEAI